MQQTWCIGNHEEQKKGRSLLESPRQHSNGRRRITNTIAAAAAAAKRLQYYSFFDSNEGSFPNSFLKLESMEKGLHENPFLLKKLNMH